MTKNKNTNRNSLWASGLSLVLCLAMLIGTTFAWFSDTVSNKGNRIQAGNLSVGFLASEEEENGNLKGTISDLGDSAVKLFELTNWAPGDTATRYIKATNTGSLALKYDINFVVSGANNALADAIKIDVSKVTDSATVQNGDATGATAENVVMNGVLNAKDAFHVYKIDLTFMQSAGNTYNGDDANVLDFGLDVILNATQTNENAKIVNAKTISDVANAPENSTVVLMKDILDDTAELAFTYPVNFDLNGYTLRAKSVSMSFDKTGTVDIGNSGASEVATNYFGASDGNIDFQIPHASINVNAPLAVTENHEIIFNVAPNTANINVSPMTLSLNNGVVTPTTASPATSLQNGRLVVSEDVTVGTITIAESATNVSIENNGAISKVDNKSETPVVVEKNPPDESAGNVTDANTWDGKTVTAVAEVNKTYSISNGAELAWLASQVNAGNSFSGKTVILTKDINLGNHEWTPIGGGTANKAFLGGFDGQNHTILGLSINQPKLNAVGLFGSAWSAKYIKNIVIDGANVVGKDNVAILVGSFNTPITNCIVKNSNLKGGQWIGMIGGNGYGTILQCASLGGSINPSNWKFGGIAGQLGEGSTKVQQCYSNTTIKGSSTGGGIVGYAHYGNLIENNFSAATMTGTASGGLIGYSWSVASSGLPTIKNSIAVGQNANPNGGLIAEKEWRGNDAPLLTNCYWDLETTGATSSKFDIGEGKSTADLQKASTYSDWDTSIWDIKDGSYPTLKWMQTAGLVK